MSKDVILNIGFKSNSSKYLLPAKEATKRYSSPEFNFKIGITNTKWEHGLYYGIGNTMVFSEIINEMYFMGETTKNTFGIYTNIYLFSIKENEPQSKNEIKAYTTAQLGGYHIRNDEERSKPSGLGFNCYLGFRMDYCIGRRVGVFGEIGYDYYPIVDNVSMRNITYRIGARVIIYKKPDKNREIKSKQGDFLY